MRPLCLREGPIHLFIPLPAASHLFSSSPARPPWAEAQTKRLTNSPYKPPRQPEGEGQKAGNGRGLWRISSGLLEFHHMPFMIELLILSYGRIGKPTVEPKHAPLTLSAGRISQGETPASVILRLCFRLPRGEKTSISEIRWLPVSAADSRLNYGLIHIAHQLKD